MTKIFKIYDVYGHPKGKKQAMYYYDPLLGTVKDFNSQCALRQAKGHFQEYTITNIKLRR